VASWAISLFSLEKWLLLMFIGYLVYTLILPIRVYALDDSYAFKSLSIDCFGTLYSTKAFDLKTIQKTVLLLAFIGVLYAFVGPGRLSGQ